MSAMKRKQETSMATEHCAATEPCGTAFRVTSVDGATRGQLDALRGEIFERVKAYHDLAYQPKPFVPGETLIPHADAVFDAREITALVGVALDFWLTLGPFGERFEGALKRFFGARDAVLVNSGSSANLLAMSSLCSHKLEGRLRPGDEVITPAVTFPTTFSAVVQRGLVPVVVDVEPGTYNLNAARVAEAVSDKTRAILLPHTLGNSADMDAIASICRERNLWLVEDCCDALGSRFGGQLVGTFGEMASLSFYPTHHITTGEGGAVVINRSRFSRIARSIRDWGRDCWCAPGVSNTCGKRFGWQLGELPFGYDHKYVFSHIGYNFKPTDMQAAIGSVQVERVAAFEAARRRNFLRLRKGLASLEEFLLMPVVHPKADPSWFGFPVTVRKGVNRRELIDWLEQARIVTRQVFAGNILRQEAFLDAPHRVHGDLTETDRVMTDSFFVGVYPGLTDEMIDFMIKRFIGFFAASRRRRRTAVPASA
jgi:CDP-6-deoxy-D-xylo-4-hexulose-3-dehydrase